MNTPNESPVLKVSDNPTEAINEVVLDELNRINQKAMRVQNENVKLKAEMGELKEQVGELEKSLKALWNAYNSHPHHV